MKDNKGTLEEKVVVSTDMQNVIMLPRMPGVKASNILPHTSDVSSNICTFGW